MDEATSFQVPPTYLWPDVLPAAHDDRVAAVLGKQNGARWVKAGGTLRMLESIASGDVKAVAFDAWRTERVEAAGVTIDVGGGVQVVVPPLDCWPDTSGMTDRDAMAVVLGEHFEACIAAGLTVESLLRIMLGSDGEPGKSGASPAT